MAEVSPCLSPVSRAGARGLRLDPGGGKKRWPSHVGSGLSSCLGRETTLALECLGTSCRKSPGGMGGRGLGRKEEKKREIRREKATEKGRTQRASLGHCGGKEREAGASSPAQTVAWAGAAHRLGGRRFGAQQLPLRTVRGPLSIPSCIQQKNLLRATRGLASVDLVRLAGPRPSLPRARSRSLGKPRQAGRARPRRRPQPRPAALSAQGWVSHAGEGGEPGAWSGPFEAKRRFGSAVRAEQPSPRAGLRFRGDSRSPGLGAPESPGPGWGKERGPRPG